MSREIGGFFELELHQGKEYHSSHFKYNLARNALVSLLQEKQIKVIFIPSYICDSIINVLQKNNIQINFYSIDDITSPSIPETKDENHAILLVNYFDLVDLNLILKKNDPSCTYIIDNSQAFFSDPIEGVDSIYSARKFFGVPDGAYLFTDKNIGNYKTLPETYTYELCEPLINRIELGAEKTYGGHKRNMKQYSKMKIGRMSALSEAILKSIDYESVKEKRLSNFKYLHEEFRTDNSLKINYFNVPMCYPFLLNKGKVLRNKLINNKIYTPTYWQNVLSNSQSTAYDNHLVENMVCLPIDQRYRLSDMKKMVNIIKSCIG